MLIEVQDSGTGIAADKLEAIFDPFVTSKPEGLGMGLSICRSIIERHDGKITAANNPDRGATFSIVLPDQPLFGFVGAIKSLRRCRESRSDPYLQAGAAWLVFAGAAIEAQPPVHQVLVLQSFDRGSLTVDHLHRATSASTWTSASRDP